MKSLVDAFFAPISALVQPEMAEVRGAWSMTKRRAYAPPAQLGTGTGPFVELDDACWRGAIDGATPLVGLAILCTSTGAWWVKSEPATMSPMVEVSLTSAAWTPEGAMFGGRLHGGFLPAVPVERGRDVVASCRLGPPRLAVGRRHVVAQIADASLVVLMLPGAAIKVGRCRRWQLRRALASTLSGHLREILTRGRAGSIFRSP